MSNVDTRTAVIKAIKDTLALDDDYLVQDDQLICEDLGADSLDIRVIGLDIEYICRIDISDSDLYGVKTVGQLVDLAARLLGEVQSRYPLTWPRALRAAKQGAIIECANAYKGVHQRGYYNPARGVLMDADIQDEVLWLASDDVDAGWRIVKFSNKEVQP